MVAVVADQNILVGVVYDDETELVAVVAVYLAGTGEKKNRCFYQSWYPKGYLELLALKSNRPQCMDNREKALRAWESEEKSRGGGQLFISATRSSGPAVSLSQTMTAEIASVETPHCSLIWEIPPGNPAASESATCANLIVVK